MIDPRLNDLIDLERYPLEDLDSHLGRALLEQCRHDLAERALCQLPGFVRPHALALLVAEASALIPRAYYRNEVTNFSWDPEADRKWPESHPNRAEVSGCYRQVLTGDFPADGYLQALYRWPGLTEFIRRVYRAETMYRSTCPDVSLSLKIAEEGDTDGWHYDGNDGVVSLLLQKPDDGGEFEYAPYIRTPDDERYDDLAALFADPDRYGVRPSMAPGTFVLFNGNLSVHRVRPVGQTKQPRIIALFCYDQTPDYVFDPTYCDHMRTFPTDAETTT